MKKVLFALSLPLLLSACDSGEQAIIDPIDFSAYTSMSALYDGKIKTLVDTKCSSCHVVGKKASDTDLLFEKENDAANLATLEGFIVSEGGDRLISKATGRRHGGGTQISSGGAEAQALAELTSRTLAKSE